jgi:cephalosporin-C deacetylase-like acetyl esterase
VDGARIGIVGHSRGGMASLLAAASDMRIRSTVALSATTDHLRYVRGLREYAPSRYAETVKAHGGTPAPGARVMTEKGLCSENHPSAAPRVQAAGSSVTR